MDSSIKNRLKNGHKVSNGWLHIPSSWSAEVMTTAGWDTITVDMQHGMIGFDTALRMLQSLGNRDLPAFARIGWNRPELIMKMLDAGVQGIICPMVNSRSDCEDFIRSAKYPPHGNRSMGPTRARIVHGMDYASRANESIILLAMIETVQAYENLDEILSVDGLDGVFVGSSDLTQSILASRSDSNVDELFEDMIETIAAKTNEKYLIPGIWCPSLEKAKFMLTKGYSFISFMSDSMILTNYSRQLAAELNQSF